MRAVIACCLLAALSGCDEPMKHGEIRPADEMKAKHGLTAEHRLVIHLDPAKVPSDLRDLVPYAEKWGIGDDIIRDNFQTKASVVEKQDLARAIAGRNSRITQWLNGQPSNTPMSDEAAAFMYMQLGLEEMALWRD
jgi:hypothetical protein